MKLVLETSVAIGFLVATAVSAREILLSPVYQGAVAGSQAIATVQAQDPRCVALRSSFRACRNPTRGAENHAA